MPKTDKKSFSRASKENYDANQPIFSLTDFDLTETGVDVKFTLSNITFISIYLSRK